MAKGLGLKLARKSDIVLTLTDLLNYIEGDGDVFNRTWPVIGILKHLIVFLILPKIRCTFLEGRRKEVQEMILHSCVERLDVGVHLPSGNL